MSLKWTILAMPALVAIVIATFVIYETTVHPGEIQRQQFANGVWGIAAVIAISLWVWHAFSKKKKSDYQR